MRCGMGVDAVSGETAGSIYTTRIKTFMKKVLQSCSRSGGIQHADSAITKHEAGCWPGVFQKPATTLRGTYVFEGSCSHRGTDRSDRSCIQQHFRDERKAARYIRSLEDTLFQCCSLICSKRCLVMASYGSPLGGARRSRALAGRTDSRSEEGATYAVELRALTWLAG